MSMVVEEAGAALRSLRADAGVSIEELAARTGYPMTTISRVERATRPAPEGYAEKVRDALAEITRERHERVVGA